MSNEDFISPSYLAQALSYNPETGTLQWKKRPLSHFVDDVAMRKWNTNWAGKRAGSLSGNGRRQVTVNFRNFVETRVAYALMTGEWPQGEVDHINCNKFDNRWDNLRVASRTQNANNIGLRKNNKSGYKGVSYDKATGRYIALIRSGGKKINLGRFDTAEEAHAAYCKAAKELHGDFARTA